MRRFLFLLIIGLISHQILAQQDRIDSLQRILAQLDARDTTYVVVANDLAFRLSMSDQQQSAYYMNLAISVAKGLNYERGIIRAITIKGNSFLIFGMPDQALSYYLEAMSYQVEKYPLEFVRLNNNVGEVYRRKEVYDSSLKYFNRALSLAVEKITAYQPIIIYSNLGEVSLMQGDIPKAKMFFNTCLENALTTDHLRGQGYGYYGLAECAFAQGETKEAIKLMQKSISIRLEAPHLRGTIQSYLKLGVYYNENKLNTDSAIYYWSKTEELAKANETNDLLSEVYDKLYHYYIDKSDIDNAALYLNRHKHLSDSIRNAEFISNVDKIQAALQSELISAENELLRQEGLQRKAEEDARLIVISLAFLIVLGLALATYQYRMRQKATKEAESEFKFTQALLALSKELNEDNFRLAKFMDHLLSSSLKVLQCDRATYWVQNEETNVISLHSIAERKNSPEIPPATFKRSEFPEFFNEFMSNRAVALPRIKDDPRLSKVYDKYFSKAGIESLLNAPILIDGKFTGFISYTMTNKKIREWDAHEQRFVGSLADMVVVAIAKRRGNLLEFEKEELIRKLQTRNKSLQEFNSVISHNLREPLTQIIGLSGILKEGKVDRNGESMEIISLISDSSNRVDKVIQELSIILNENDPKPGDFRLLSLEKLLKDVTDLMKNEIQSHNVTIDQSLELSKIKSYKPYLSDAIYHLISNCIKFAEPSKRLKIKIRSFEDELKQYIAISDNGRGMDMGLFGDKIFKMYQRFHLDIEGRGIGLFIVKNRINVLNGSIRVESEEGIGSQFTIEFPKYVSSIN